MPWVGLTLILLFGLTRCQTAPQSASHPASHPKRIVILATNDIHGALEPTELQNSPIGGMAFWGQVVGATRTALNKTPNAGMLLVDAGDQFQGTLLSNYDEGQTLFRVMNEIGYDAAVPGNHAFDFGPIGWLKDKKDPSDPTQTIRGAWDRLVHLARFSLISANTYVRSSIKSRDGRPLTVRGVRCEPVDGAGVDWERAEHPPFATPYILREVAGVTVAVIGMDHAHTPHLTTPDNVADLCFRDEFDSYLAVRKALATQADIFILAIHNGDSHNEAKASELTRKIMDHSAQRLVDLVIAGHTHTVHNSAIGTVPVIQSGANAERFGRIELFWDPVRKQLLTQQTRSYVGVGLFHKSCDALAADFCTVTPDGLAYDGELLQPVPAIEALIGESQKQLAPLAKRRLGHSHSALTRHRIAESPLANTLTDEVRRLTGADIVFLNTGGIRADIPRGTVRYEHLFRTLPFANHGVRLGPIQLDDLMRVLKRSIQTCGSYGALMQSGLRVLFSRDCRSQPSGIDKLAELHHVALLDGTTLYDRKAPNTRPTRQVFQIVTFDFLASGGDGFNGFKDIPLIQDYGILRELLVSDYLKNPFEWRTQIDGRWQESQTGASLRRR